MIQLAALPETVQLKLDEHADVEDAPVWTFRPLTLMQTTDLLPEYVENKGAAFVTATRAQFVGVTGIEVGGKPFDATDAHYNAINPGWVWELGRKLWERSHLSEQERGK